MIDIHELAQNLTLPDRLRESKLVVVSFSGGATSGFMTRLIQLALAKTDVRIEYIFANTGQEHPKTLDFVQACSDHWGINITWVEGHTSPIHGEGPQVKIVNHQNACRDGTLFEKLVSKHGLISVSAPLCTRDLKRSTINKFVTTLGYSPKDRTMAIGIRADEMDRISPQFEKGRIWYPLIDLNITKSDINNWWSEQDFKLEIERALGNCVWCFKKSDNNLRRAYQLIPEYFDVPLRLEKQYENIHPLRKTILRYHRKYSDAVIEWKSMKPLFDDVEDEGDCKSSCEAFGTENADLLDDLNED